MLVTASLGQHSSRVHLPDASILTTLHSFSAWYWVGSELTGTQWAAHARDESCTQNSYRCCTARRLDMSAVAQRNYGARRWLTNHVRPSGAKTISNRNPTEWSSDRPSDTRMCVQA
eukprot:13131454-Alexandrium_andersonii.AAC.1